MSRKDVEELSLKPFGKTTALISITDFDYAFANLKYKPQYLLQLAFDDVPVGDGFFEEEGRMLSDEEIANLEKKYHSITDEQVEQITCFYNSVKDQSVVEILGNELLEILYGLGCYVGEESDKYLSVIFNGYEHVIGLVLGGLYTVKGVYR